MPIIINARLGLSEFETAALKKRFIDLVMAGELRPQNSDEFMLAHGEPPQLYVLAPYLLEVDGELSDSTSERIDSW
jgi:hypothetical protein